ncbi:response regulator transcription factor [Luteibacter sp.]|jgi:DNA-binding response OmpR family regulator|uniref:response regulator transcription factor n=1 Tax=Luteibacter sp. TaxID=1886636 RepID=UPI002F41F427
MTERSLHANDARARIALLEDDIELRDQILLPGLADFGFDVHGFGRAAELYAAMLGNSFDIVVLDVGLPDEDGFSVTRRLRGLSPIGIVMLTGRDGVPDRVRGLSEGADAYLSKPVQAELLAATLRSLQRRLHMQAGGSSPSLPAGQWSLDAGGWCLIAPGGVMVALTQAERRVIGLLLEKPAEPVSRELIIAALTANVHDFDPHRLETIVHRLRKKVSDGTGEALPVRAVHGVGYVMIP